MTTPLTLFRIVMNKWIADPLHIPAIKDLQPRTQTLDTQVPSFQHFVPFHQETTRSTASALVTLLHRAMKLENEISKRTFETNHASLCNSGSSVCLIVR